MAGRPIRRRRAITLIELLVVIGLIGVLAGLLVPAVQSAREAARQAGCRSHLHQIGIAMHAYHDVHAMFPPGNLLTRPFVSGNRLSGFVYLLPHLDQAVLFHSINMDFSSWDSITNPLVENHTARVAKLDILLCPSDGTPHHLSNYRFNHGRLRTWESPAFDGPFNSGVRPSQASVTDGLSRTAFVSERIAGTFRPGAPDSRRDMKRQRGRWPRSLGEEAIIAQCLADPTAPWWPTEGRYWYFKDMMNTDYNHAGTPNDQRPSCGGSNFGLHPPRSYHPGKVEVLFGDGHTEGVSNGIAPPVWRSLGTHARGDG